MDVLHVVFIILMCFCIVIDIKAIKRGGNKKFLIIAIVCCTISLVANAVGLVIL